MLIDVRKRSFNSYMLTDVRRRSSAGFVRLRMNCGAVEMITYCHSFFKPRVVRTDLLSAVIRERGANCAQLRCIACDKGNLFTFSLVGALHTLDCRIGCKNSSLTSVYLQTPSEIKK